MNYTQNFFLTMVGSLLLAATSSFAQDSPPRQKTNIIFILADDLGYGDVGCYGQQKIKTPHIDQLAAQGMKFTQFYAGTPVCAPSRSTLLTGLHTGHTPIRGNKTLGKEGQPPLPDTIVTIAQQLQKAGYKTGVFGKWSMGFPGSGSEPLDKGFDRFYGYNCQTLAHDYYPDHLYSDRNRVEMPDNPKKFSVYSADKIQEEAMKFMEANKNSPFFVYLPTTLPHADLTVPHDAVYNSYVKAFNEKPAVITSRKDPMGKPFEPYPHAAFAAMVSRLDKHVGEIMDFLHKNGLDQNTLIIFTSDNGPHKEDHADPDFFNSGGNLKGLKRDMYEGGIREPFIARWTGKVPAHSESNYNGAFWDAYATFSEIAGADKRANDGISFLPTLLQRPQQAKHEYLYWELHEAGGKQAVRWNNWKGIRLNVSTNENAPIELYDLSTDSLEQHNVATANPDVVKRMDAFMKSAHRQSPQWPFLPTEGATGEGNQFILNPEKVH